MDNYQEYNTSMLLNVKERMDSMFEYRGGLSRMTEEAFHAILKKQLKMKKILAKEEDGGRNSKT